MRVRLIRPAYWTDSDLHLRLTADVREFYIGLWMLADDAGYVSWDPDRVGAELYPYRAPSWRARRIGPWLDLIGKDHALLLECGKHVLIPNLTKYQKPPKPSSQNKTDHQTCLRHMAPAGTTGDQVAPAQGFSRGSIGKGIEGRVRADEDNDGETEFQRMVPRVVALGGRS